MKVEFIQDPDTKVWWYVSVKKFRKPGQRLWVGKFTTKEAAIAAAKAAGELKR